MYTVYVPEKKDYNIKFKSEESSQLFIFSSFGDGDNELSPSPNLFYKCTFPHIFVLVFAVLMFLKSTNVT